VAAAIGAFVILCGILFEVAQLIVSIKQRESNRDLTGDPWGGRTLEWSVSSPPPFYNFAVIPEVQTRDAFWEMKKIGPPRASRYRPIHMPRNTATGVIIGAFSFALGFGLIWHIWWMALVGLLGIVISLITHSFNQHREYFVPAVDIARIERLRSPALIQQV